MLPKSQMFTNKINLIPRYNWDYGFFDFARAFVAAFNQNTADGLKNTFQKKPIFTNSGRTSLYVILKSLRLPEGSYVGVPLFCCPVVFDAIMQADLVPRFIDIDSEDYNISSQDLAKKRNQLSALVVVHMFGHPADMDTISSVSDGIPVIEDCAQSLFSTYKGKYTGFLSHVSFFSFRSGKYVSAGEGGAIFPRNANDYETIEKLVDSFDQMSSMEEVVHCAATYIKSTLYHRPWYGLVGYPIGTKLDRKFNLTAKSGFKPGQISKADLKIINFRIPRFIQQVQRQRNNSIYLLEHIRAKNAILPTEKQGSWSNYYQFPIRFRSESERDAVADYLFARGIDTAKYLDEVTAVATANYGYQGDCPTSEVCSKTTLIIPNHYTLSKKDLDYIAGCVNEAVKGL